MMATVSNKISALECRALQWFRRYGGKRCEKGFMGKGFEK